MFGDPVCEEGADPPPASADRVYGPQLNFDQARLDVLASPLETAGVRPV